ncbi:MAG: Ankyrin [Gemmatimonadetes bacterium]|nr:Ankyrin [Gemmatimonadota bacterium]
MAEQPVIEAAKAGDAAAAERALSDGAGVDERDERGWTALCWAAGGGEAALVRLLIDRGADVTLTGTDSRTPLMIAKAAGRTEVAELLTAAEQGRGVWQDPGETRKHCKGYRVGDLRQYDGWSESRVQAAAEEDALADEDVIYLHHDLTVTRSIWPGEQVIFTGGTPEWRSYCERTLGFALPADLL